MAIPSPATTELVVKHDLKGRMSVFYNGERLPFVTSIQVDAEYRETAVVKVSFLGRGVRFETEEPVID